MVADWCHLPIYPRSFQDSNGDGIGDLNGIASRLDHLVTLGIDAIWLSPIFSSPMDFGYDVSDFRAVDPIFGTLDDFDRLLAAAHAKGLIIPRIGMPGSSKADPRARVLFATGTFGASRRDAPEQLGQ